MQSTAKRLMIRVFGLGFCLAYYLNGVKAFVEAYLSPHKLTLIYINNYGEAHIELIMTLVSIPCVLYFIIHTLIEWKAQGTGHRQGALRR